MENYEIPSAVRKIIRRMQRGQIVNVKFKNCTKLTDHFFDPNGIFYHEYLSGPEIDMTIQLVDWY